MTLDMRREIAYDVGASTHVPNSIAFSPPRVQGRCARTYRQCPTQGGLLRVERRAT